MMISGKIYSLAICLLMIMSSVSGSEYSLQQCKELAVQNNVEVQNAFLEVKASDEVIKAVKTRFYPKIDAQLITFRTQKPLLDMNIPSMNLPVYDGNPVNLATPTQFAYVPEIPISALEKGTVGTATVTMPLYTGGRLLNGKRLATLSKEVNVCKYELAKRNVLLGTEERYWQIITLKDKLKTVDLFSTLLDTLYKEASVAISAGLINRNDLIKISIKQSEMQSNRLQLQNGIKLATMAFCQYTGMHYDSLMVFTDTVVNNPPPAQMYKNADSALLKRHEYTLLQKAIAAQKIQTKLKIGEYLPAVAVGGGELYLKDLGRDGFNGFVMASVKVPLTDWWEGCHSIREFKLKQQIVEQDSRNNTELLKLQIEKAWNELNEQYKQLEIVERTQKLALENLKVNTDNYKAGMVNISEMLEAQAMYKKSDDDLHTYIINYRVKLVTYMQLTGQ